ncbi:MAG: ferredoxin [Planctomycetota bacterium]|nr:ferredoxin [Planctomycetota bacterium]
MKAHVNQELCIGCGLCSEICPLVFELGDNDHSQVTVDTVPPEAEEACQEAAEQCPVEAITIEE